MAHISIFISSISSMNNRVHVDGIAIVGPNGENVGWSCEHAWDEIAYTINNACRDAAVQAAIDAGYNVGANDKKTMYCPAVDV
jgi:hypothetical protein